MARFFTEVGHSFDLQTKIFEHFAASLRLGVYTTWELALVSLVRLPYEGVGSES